VFTNNRAGRWHTRGAGRARGHDTAGNGLVINAPTNLGVDPIALRGRNFITEFPYATPVAVEYDNGRLCGDDGQAGESPISPV